MRTLLIIAGAVVALLLLAVLVGPLLIDWNAFKPRLAAAVEQATGRKLEIEGDLQLSILPSPTLSAAGARLSNIEGGSQPTMVSLKTLEVQVALGPLLGGDLQVESISLVEPQILLERLADGRVNWQLEPAPEAPAGEGTAPGPEREAQPAGSAERPAESPDGRPLPVSLERLSIEKGTLIYRDAASGSEERVEALDATLSAESLRGPFTIEGSARIRRQATRFSARTGRLGLAEETPVTVTLALPETGGAEARFNGTVTLGETASAAGDLSARGENLLSLLAVVAPEADLPGGLAQSFTLSSRVTYEDGQLRQSAIDLLMADSALGGELSIRPGEPTEVAATLKVSRLDLDSLLADGGGGGQDPQPTDAFALPEGLRGQLDLQIDTLVYRGEVVRQVLVNADLQDGRLALNQALALLPGGGNLVLSGELTAQSAAPRFTGRLEATADNLRALLAWLGIEVEGVPSERLRRTSLLASLDVTPEEASITGIDLEVDTSRITGGVAIAFRDRLGLGIGLSADRINLDAYLPPKRAPEASGAATPPASAEPKQERQSRSAEGADEKKAPPADAPRPAEPAPDSPLASIDANLDLKLGRITYNGQSAREVTLAGTLQQGRLTLRRLTVGDLAGGAFSLSGVFTGLPDAPSVEDGNFDISVTDPARLSRLLGQPADGALARLGAFRASGSASGSAQGFTYNADVTSLGGSIFSSGRVSGLGDALKVSDGRIEATGLEGPALARVAGLPGDSPLARAETLDLSSQFDFSLAEARFDTRLKTLGAEFVAEGTAADFASGLPRFDFRFAAIHGDLARLLRRALGEAPLAPGAGKLDLRAQVSGSPLKFQLAEIAGDIGPTIESGTITVDLARVRPQVTAELKTREIDLERLLGPGGGGGQDPAPRWSRQPLELEALRSLDASFELEAAGLRQGDLVLAPARLGGTLTDSRLVLDRLDGGFYDGQLTANGELDAGGSATPTATLALKLARVDAGALLRALGTDRVAGRLDLDAELATRGDSEAALVTALDGEAKLGGELTVEAKAQEQVGNIVLGILGQQIRELRGVTNPLNELFAAFAGRPGKLSGTVQVADGVARTQDLQLAGEGARLQARGTLANLPAWTMGLQTALYREGESEPKVQVDLNGPLDEPNVRLKGAGLQIAPGSSAPEPANPLEEMLRQALPGQQQQRQQDQDSPESQSGEEDRQQPKSPPKPADVLRGLIQGLGKGG